MKKSPKLVLCSLALCAAFASSAAHADEISPKGLPGQDGKMSTQGLKRAQKAEANKKLLEKQRAENRAREEARARSKGKCKGKDCPNPVYDQSFLYNK